jgi:hypothetical protein
MVGLKFEIYWASVVLTLVVIQIPVEKLLNLKLILITFQNSN